MTEYDILTWPEVGAWKFEVVEVGSEQIVAAGEAKTEAAALAAADLEIERLK
jgi:hypothetical protein